MMYKMAAVREEEEEKKKCRGGGVFAGRHPHRNHLPPRKVAGKENPAPAATFKVLLSARFVFLSVAAASLFAFGVGRVCRSQLVHHVVLRAAAAAAAAAARQHQHQQTPPATCATDAGVGPSSLPSPSYNDAAAGDDHTSASGISHSNLPLPMLPAGKRMPNTLYTSRQLNTGIPTTSDSVLLARPPAVAPPSSSASSSFSSPAAAGGQKEDEERRSKHKIVRSIEIKPGGTTGGIDNVSAAPSSYETSEDEDDDEEGEKEIHEPSGQHLLIDIANVDMAFLNSEERLATAMIELVNESGLTMLSYHCHSLEPIGVSCVAVLLESHVSFHTWPVEGVITLDVFTCGPKPLRPLVKFVEKLFGIPRRQQQQKRAGEEFEPPRVNWIMKNRGFPLDGGVAQNPESVEFRQFMVGWMEYDLKEEVATVETDFQRIEVFDVINPRFRTLESYRKSLTHDGSYESLHPELFLPDRMVYLDDIMQSRRFGEGAYHESLVHPAMFAHDDPRRVAIVGGGEGATLREVLKHRTVDTVTMVEIDGEMVNASRTYLPEWSYCGNLVGSEPSCFDDPRAELIITDAIGWFIDHFGEGADVNDEDRYDVVIMDALDPSSVVEFSDVLYNNDDLVAAIGNALTDEGILIAQVGQAKFLDDPPTQYTRESVLVQSFIPQLQKHGFEKIKDYEDFHGGFMGVWSYMVAFKDGSASENWYLPQAHIDLEIQARILPTVAGESSLRYFDGAAMQSLTYPSRSTEEVFCRRDDKPEHCGNGHGFDPERHNAPITAFEVRASELPGAGRGIYFKEDVPKDSYVAIDEAVHSMLVVPTTRKLMKSMDDVNSRWKIFDWYFFGYGFATDFFGDPAYLVDPGIMTFINHGCNGTNNINEIYSVTEMTADPLDMPPDLMNSEAESYVHSPYIDRNYHHLFYYAYTNRDIAAGTELLDNYLAYLHEGNWEWGILNYREMCMKARPGAVTAYEEHDDDRGVEY